MIRRLILITLAALPAAAWAGDKQSTDKAAAEKAPAAKKPVVPVNDANLPDVVAKVNGVDIKKGDLNNAVETVRQQLQLVGQSVPDERKDEMYRSLLEDLIATELLAQEAGSRKLAVADAEIDKFVQEFKDRFPSEEVFQRAIKEQGIAETQLRADVRRQMQIKKLLDKEVLGKIAVDEAAAKKFYGDNPDKFQEPETVHAKHVLVSVDAKADEKAKKAARAEADAVLADAKAKKNWDDLVKAHSDDPGSKEKGGDLGFFPKGEMVPAFEEAAWKLKPGEFSPVVETAYGFHVIQMVERKDGRKLPFSEVKADITDYLKEEKAQTAAKGYVEGLRKKAKVDIFI